MASPQQGLKGLAGAIGFFFGALLLSALVGAATAAAQRSDGLLAQPSSDACTFACDISGNTAGGNSVLQNNTGTNNTGFGDSALSHNTTGTYDSAFGSNALLRNSEIVEESRAFFSRLRFMNSCCFWLDAWRPPAA
jgi:hypothetical protein